MSRSHIALSCILIVIVAFMEQQKRDPDFSGDPEIVYPMNLSWDGTAVILLPGTELYLYRYNDSKLLTLVERVRVDDVLSCDGNRASVTVRMKRSSAARIRRVLFAGGRIYPVLVPSST